MEQTLQIILDEYKQLPQVVAIALGGSAAAKTADKSSDVDVYVFVDEQIPVNEREKLVKKYSSKYEVGGEYFGAGDEFFVDNLGTQLDVMFWEKTWFEEIVTNVWEKHYPSNGYKTCFLYTLDVFKIVYDKSEWLQGLKTRLNTDYPEELRQNIIRRNMMLLKDKPFASYYEQIAKAIERKDLNSVNHRVAAFMASYFDIVFAINRLLHPGEKRLVQYAKANCKVLPKDFEQNINALFSGSESDSLKILSEMAENLRPILSE